MTAAVLKSGGRLECSLVLVGVGARPNTDLFAGQLDLVQGPPGGIKVDEHLQVNMNYTTVERSRVEASLGRLLALVSLEFWRCGAHCLMCMLPPPPPPPRVVVLLPLR